MPFSSPCFGRLVALASALAFCRPTTLAAQEVAPVWATVAPALEAPQDTPERRHPGWLRPVASLILPGTGQLIGGEHRGTIYLAVEGLLLVRFFSYQAEGNRRSTQYRDLAFTVARAPFDPVIRDTAFSYFEKMAQYVESGPFDTEEGAGLSPPEDRQSYNGSQWELAKQTFFSNPDSTPDVSSEEYQRALAFYRERAVGSNFQWSWRNAGLEQDLYRRTIHESDEGFRRATQHLGLLLANHLISAIDAFISTRLSRNGRDVQVGSGMLFGPGDRQLKAFTTISIAF